MYNPVSTQYYVQERGKDLRREAEQYRFVAQYEDEKAGRRNGKESKARQALSWLKAYFQAPAQEEQQEASAPNAFCAPVPC